MIGPFDKVSVAPLAILWLALGCADAELSVSSTRWAIEDPDGVVPDIVGPVQLLVMPGSTYDCVPAAGVLDPALPVDGSVDGFIRDVSFPLDGEARVSVPPGPLAVVVRGRDASGTLVATGCSAVEIAAGEMRSIGLVLRRAVVLGVCGNGDVEAGEECDDGDDPARRLMDGDGCDALCRSEPFPVEAPNVLGVMQGAPAAAWRDGGSLALAWNLFEGTRNVRLRLFDADGGTGGLSSGLRLPRDAETAPGTQTETRVGVGGDRLAIAWTDLDAGDGDVRVAFFAVESLREEGPSALVSDGPDGVQGSPAVQVASTGAALVVFEDDRSPTGLHARAIPATGTEPTAGPVVVGGAGPGAAEPALAWTGNGHLLAFSRSGDVYIQRLNVDGTPSGEPASVSAESAERAAPAIAALPGDTALVAWVDSRETASGDGLSIRGRRFSPTGQPQGPELTLDTTVGADRGRPDVAPYRGGFVVTWELDGEGVRARFFDALGAPALNRDRFPSTSDFLVAGDGATEPAAAAGGNELLMFVWRPGGTPNLTARVSAQP